MPGILATATLVSQSPYSWSAPFKSPQGEKESADDYEARCWRERCHRDDKGVAFIPPMAFKNCLAEAAGSVSV